MTRRSAMYYTVGQAVLACSAALSWWIGATTTVWVLWAAVCAASTAVGL